MTTEIKQHDEFKSVKQRLSAVQLVIKKHLKSGQLPRGDDAELFIATSREMDRLCEKPWRAEMDNYMDRLAEFETAMKQNDLQAVDHVFHELIGCKNGCHKEFRKR